MGRWDDDFGTQGVDLQAVRPPDIQATDFISRSGLAGAYHDVAVGAGWFILGRVLTAAAFRMMELCYHMALFQEKKSR